MNNAKETIPCDCSLSGSNSGRCPWAPPSYYSQYAGKMLILYDQMGYCHSKDRDNLVAFGDCGTQGVQNFDWQDAVRGKLSIETHPRRTDSRTINCIDTYHPHSLTNYMKIYYSFDEIAALLRAQGAIL